MKTTIDQTGRVVIPVVVREKAGLRPGSELEVLMDDISIRLVPIAPAPRLTRRGKRLIAVPTATQKDLPEVDLASLVEEERNRWPW